MAINQDDIKGRAKIAAGAVIGDKNLEDEGRMDRMAGQAKEHINTAANKAMDLVESLKIQASSMVDKVTK